MGQAGPEAKAQRREGAAGLRGTRARRGLGGRRPPPGEEVLRSRFLKINGAQTPEIPGKDCVRQGQAQEECSWRYVCTAHHLTDNEP